MQEVRIGEMYFWCGVEGNTTKFVKNVCRYKQWIQSVFIIETEKEERL
jgi:hypothetical protein